MKYSTIFKDCLNCDNEDQVFDFLINNLKPSSKLWSYFVDWNKVNKNVRKVEVSLNTLNYLIGKKNFDDEFRYLIKSNPRLIPVLPLLVVSRDHSFNILVDYQDRILRYENYDFTIQNPTDEDIERLLFFTEKSGLKKLLKSSKIKSLVDYMFGVEAGLDSNGRKNRVGKTMESIIEVFIKHLCNEKGYDYLTQANATKIKENFGIDVPVDKSSRKYDFVVKTNTNLTIFEVNFYGGGGSKLKSTAGEYRNLYDILNGQFPFIWITDGIGWEKTQLPLRESFDHNEFILSLAMLERGILEKLV
ncbi:MAG: type II restriction endonuclease [Thermoguttaceae bacterium]|nr:type II restriction endonuclease [Thermoguttaceae bacterium]